jgi:hypothetical protein
MMMDLSFKALDSKKLRYSSTNIRIALVNVQTPRDALGVSLFHATAPLLPSSLVG